MGVFDSILKKFAPNYKTAYGTSTDVSAIKDIEGSTTAISSGYAAPAVTFFNGADGGFGAAARWLRIPMNLWNEISLVFVNTLGVSVTLDIYLWLNGHATLNAMTQVGSFTVANNVVAGFTPGGGGAGAGANYYPLPALASPCAYVVLAITPASDPSSGYIRLYAERK